MFVMVSKEETAQQFCLKHEEKKIPIFHIVLYSLNKYLSNIHEVVRYLFYEVE